jgi:hypothetical protein
MNNLFLFIFINAQQVVIIYLFTQTYVILFFKYVRRAAWGGGVTRSFAIRRNYNIL